MKLKSVLRIIGISACLGIQTTSSFAVGPDVQSFLLAKGQEFEQTGTNVPSQISSNSPFSFFSTIDLSYTGAVTAASLRLPNGKTNQFVDQNDVFEFQQSFSSKTLLDRTFGKGKYTFSINTLADGAKNPVLNLTPDAYPPTPHVENWSDLQAVDSGLPFVVNWNRFLTGSSNDFISCEISDTNGNPVFSTPGMLEGGALDGTNRLATVPENTLAPDQAYEGRILFVKRTGQNNTNYPGVTGISGYFKETSFTIQTLVAAPAAGRIQFSASRYSVGESDGTAMVTILRSSSVGAVSVNVSTSNGTALSGLDYTATMTTVNFADGETSATFTFPVLNDFLLEGDETVNVSLTSPTGGAILGRSSAVVTIVDDEIPAAGVLQFKPVNFTVKEAGKVAKFIVSRTGGTAGAVSVNYTVSSGTAQEGLDFVSTNGSVTLADKKTSGMILISLLNDALDETNETFQVTLTSVTGGAALGSNLTATATIQDDDVAGTISFKTATSAVNENANVAVITVVRSGGKAGNVTVDYATENGSAVAGSDYVSSNGTLTFGSNELTKTFTVAINNDLAAEGDESLSLKLTNPTGGASLGKITNATLTIIDDESSVSFEKAAYVVDEGKPSIVVTVVRSGASTTPVTVDYATVNGSAISTNDYKGVNGTLSFPAKTTSKTITIPIVNDALVEGNETFSVRLSNPTGGTQLGSITNTTVTISDNDQAGVISFSAATFSGKEGANATVTINRTGGAAGGVAVQFAMNGGTATKGTDYTDASGVVTFNEKETSKKITVPLKSDSASEASETVNLTLSNPTGGATLGAITSATLSIENVTSGGGGGGGGGSFTLTGPGMKATVGGAFNPMMVQSSQVLSIMNITAFAVSGTAQKTITLTLAGITPGSTGTFSLSANDAFGGYASTTTSIGSSACSTIKTYNSDSPSTGSINIIEWNTATRVFKATFSFTCHGVDAGKTCTPLGGGTPTSTNLPIPTDHPSITAGQIWASGYIVSP